MMRAAPSTSSSSTARSIPGGGADLQEAVAVRGNQILRVGSNRDVKRLRRAQTVVLDAHGATVLPGLNDARVQLMTGALTLEHLNLSPAITIDDIETELRHYAEDKPSSSWLLGRNGDDDLLAAANVPAQKDSRRGRAGPARARHQRRRQRRLGQLEGARAGRHHP